MNDFYTPLLTKLIKRAFFEDNGTFGSGNFWSVRFFAGAGRNGWAKFILPNDIVVLRANNGIRRYLPENQIKQQHCLIIEVYQNDWMAELYYRYQPIDIQDPDIDIWEFFRKQTPVCVFVGDEYKFKNAVLMSLLKI